MVYITTAPFLWGPCEPDWVNTVQAWICACGAAAPGFSSHSTVPAILAMAGSSDEGGGEECCQSRGGRLWPLSGAAGWSPCGSLAVHGILGLKEHTRSLCDSCMGECSQSSAQLCYCLMSAHAGQISCTQAKPQWADQLMYQMSLLLVDLCFP